MLLISLGKKIPLVYVLGCHLKLVLYTAELLICLIEILDFCVDQQLRIH